jgi:hypothetical protein
VHRNTILRRPPAGAGLIAQSARAAFTQLLKEGVVGPAAGAAIRPMDQRPSGSGVAEIAAGRRGDQAGAKAGGGLDSGSGGPSRPQAWAAAAVVELQGGWVSEQIIRVVPTDGQSTPRQ